MDELDPVYNRIDMQDELRLAVRAVRPAGAKRLEVFIGLIPMCVP